MLDVMCAIVCNHCGGSHFGLGSTKTSNKSRAIKGHYVKAQRLNSAPDEAKDEPTVISFSSLSSALEKAGEWHQTLTLLSEMAVALADIQYENLVKDGESSYLLYWCQHLTILRFSVVSGPHHVLLFLVEVGSVLSSFPYSKRFWKDYFVLPNVITYSAIISACSRGSQWQRALAESWISN